MIRRGVSRKSSTKEIYGISRGSKSVGHDLWRPRSSLHSSTPGSPGLRDQLSGAPPSLGARPPKARAHAVSFSRLSRGSPEESGPAEACRQPESNRVGSHSPSRGPHARLHTQAYRGLGPSAGAGPADARGARRAQALARPTLSEVAEASGLT